MIAPQPSNPTLVVPSLNLIEDIFDRRRERWPSIARIVLAGAIAQIVTLLFMEGSTFWPVVTVIILSSKNVGVTWLRSFQRIIATVIGFFLAVTLVAMFPQSPGALLFSFVPVFLVCIYFSQTVATNPYAFFMVVLGCGGGVRHRLLGEASCRRRFSTPCCSR